MKSQHLCALAALALCSIPALAADKKSAEAKEAKAPYEVAQPATESLDLEMYQRIRDEGFRHSHIMEYAGALDDDIGPRLTGSPNLAKANAWTRDQFTAMGCTNAHLESWGEFGMGWQQLNTWVRMTAPDTAVFIAQATPWSLSTNGAITGEAINMIIADEKDLEKYKGKLTGKIVLLGDMRPVPPVDKPLFHRYDDKELAEETTTEINNNDALAPPNFLKGYGQRMALRDKLLAPIFKQWMAPLADLDVTFISPRNTGGTDHLSFDAVGVPGFQFIQDPMDYESRTHHSNMDTYERLQPADLRQAAVVEAIFVYNAAMRDQMLPRKPLPRPELNDQLTAPLKNVYPDAREPEKK